MGEGIRSDSVRAREKIGESELELHIVKHLVERLDGRACEHEARVLPLQPHLRLGTP